MRRTACFSITEDLLRTSLAMPEGTTIRNIYLKPGADPSIFTFIVEHPDLPEIDDTVTIPELSPVIEADYTKKPSTWLTFKWVSSMPQPVMQGGTSAGIKTLDES